MKKSGSASAAELTANRSRTSVLTVDHAGLITAYNAAAGKSLLTPGAVGGSFVDKLAESTKFGLISNTTVLKIMAGLEAGSCTFRAEDGRTFLMGSYALDGGRRVEWIDVSDAVIATGNHDASTGLLTRQGFLTAVDAFRKCNPVGTIVHLDLDNFKEVNDLFGHATGDHLIRRFADRISAQIDGAKTHLAHGAGGEFFFVVAGQDVDPASSALLDVLGRPHLVDGKMIYSTVSAGLAPFTEDSDAESVLGNAGLALKRAKTEGGGRASTFTVEMRQAMQRKRMLEVELRKALALREFSLVYQPQFRIADRCLVGFESLLRWNHHAYGGVSPAEFIPLAEELGLILPIGEWALRTACRKAVAWPSDLSISVNVSPLQFRSPTFVSTVTAALQSSGLAPHRLDLEITEGAILANSAAIMETFSQLRALGVRFSMDDFGTGYSSLSYLQKFPFDKIKIDQSFVRNLSAGGDSLAIIRAICALGKALGLTTIAEGVETEDQLRRIEMKGCQQVQGYLTGRPLAPALADELAAATAPPERKAAP